MLTIYQSEILVLLNNFKCLRRVHIEKYITARHGSTPVQLSAMLRQLSYLGRIKCDDEYISLPGRRMNDAVITAFDVMTDLTGGLVDCVYQGCEPFAVMFSAKTTDSVYSAFGVAVVRHYSEARVCAKLQACDRETTVIFVISDIEQQRLLITEQKHYFAVQDDGKYRFFKAANAVIN